MLRRIQQAQQFEVATLVGKEKWKGTDHIFFKSDKTIFLNNFLVKSEIVGSIQQFFEENGLIQSLKNDLNYVTRQRYQLVNMWLSRMVERKNDWNQTRTDMKDKLTGERIQSFLLTPNIVILSSDF